MKTYFQLFLLTMLLTGTSYADSRFGLEGNPDVINAAEPIKPKGDKKSEGLGDPDCD